MLRSERHRIVMWGYCRAGGAGPAIDSAVSFALNAREHFPELDARPFLAPLLSDALNCRLASSPGPQVPVRSSSRGVGHVRKFVGYLPLNDLHALRVRGYPVVPRDPSVHVRRYLGLFKESFNARAV